MSDRDYWVVYRSGSNEYIRGPYTYSEAKSKVSSLGTGRIMRKRKPTRSATERTLYGGYPRKKYGD